MSKNKQQVEAPREKNAVNFDQLPTGNTKYVCKCMVLCAALTAITFMLYNSVPVILEKLPNLISYETFGAFMTGLAVYPPVIWIAKKFNE